MRQHYDVPNRKDWTGSFRVETLESTTERAQKTQITFSSVFLLCRITSIKTERARTNGTLTCLRIDMN